MKGPNELRFPACRRSGAAPEKPLLLSGGTPRPHVITVEPRAGVALVAKSRSLDRRDRPRVASAVPKAPSERHVGGRALVIGWRAAFREIERHEAHLSAEPYPSQACPRFPGADEDERRADGPVAPQSQGSQAALGDDALEVAVKGPSRRLQRRDRLRKSQEFQRVSLGGRRRAGARFVVLAAPGDGARSRLGLTVSRKVGCAVERNRVKRRVREWFRTAEGLRARGLDVVVIARSGAATARYATLARELEALLAPERPGRG